MKILKIFFIILLFYYNIFTINTQICNDRFLRNILIVFSFDGFRNSYINKNITPFLFSFRENGVSTKYLKTVFLSNGLATHHTIATGLYAGKHGVVGHATEGALGKQYRYNQELYDFNNSILPIWTVNELNGGISACMMWPGSEFEYGVDKKKPTFYKKYNASMPLERRYEIIIDWLNRTRDQPNLIMVYIEEPDKIAHITGTESRNLTERLIKLDKLSKQFQSKLLKLRLSHRANVVYLSDHGMWPVTPKQFFNLSDLPDCKNYYRFSGRHTNVYVTPLKYPDYFEECHMAIDRLFPDSVHTFKSYQMMEGITLQRLAQTLVSAPYGVAWGDNMWNFTQYWAKKYNMTVTNDTIFGVHGYKNDNDGMFMAKGPIFKRFTTVEPFGMTDLYFMFAKVLSIHGNTTNDGDFSHVAGVFKERTEEIGWSRAVAIIVSCAMLHCVLFYFFVKLFFYTKQQNEKEEEAIKKAKAKGERRAIEEIYRRR